MLAKPSFHDVRREESLVSDLGRRVLVMGGAMVVLLCILGMFCAAGGLVPPAVLVLIDSFKLQQGQQGPSALELEIVQECLGGLGGVADGHSAEPPFRMASARGGALLLLQLWVHRDSAAGVTSPCAVCMEEDIMVWTRPGAPGRSYNYSL